MWGYSDLENAGPVGYDGRFSGFSDEPCSGFEPEWTVVNTRNPQSQVKGESQFVLESGPDFGGNCG